MRGDSARIGHRRGFNILAKSRIPTREIRRCIPKIRRSNGEIYNKKIQLEGVFKKNSQSMMRCTISKCDDEEFVYDDHMRGGGHSSI